jgi:DNA-binding CsgD family transcriptional regulator
VNDKQFILETRGITEAARSADSVEDHDRFVLERLDKLIGYDVAFFVRGAPGAVAPGFDERVRRDCTARWHIFGRELDVFARAALAGRGSGIDLAFFGSSELTRQAHYREIMRPLHGRSSLMAYLSRRGHVEATLVLGRKRLTRDFTETDQAIIEMLIPTLSLCEASFGARPSPARHPALDTLTPREREVLDYLELGFTNAEIALACGNAPATVRNQLASVFRKLGATTRAEAVALALGHARGR